MLDRMRTRIKWVLFPGLNLHARVRYKRIPQNFRPGASKNVLDAGSGNGMLSYQGYRHGNKVLGLSFKDTEVSGAQSLFNGLLQIPENRLRFEQKNLYELDEFADESFDEAICAEVLEHLVHDRRVCKSLFRMLRPGAWLHVSVPNADHPYNATFPLDENESGGHVRPGYTEATLRSLLEPIGFEIAEVRPLGGPVRQFFNRRIKEIQERFGPLAGLPLFFISLLFLPFENRRKEAQLPFSLYVRAVKPAVGE